MRKLEFYRLPRTLQDRFIESTRGAATPGPLLVRRFVSKVHVRWAALALGIIAAWAVFTSFGFGSLEHSLALAPPAIIAVHVAFAASVVFCALRAQSKRWEFQRQPYPAGTYLFPAGVIDARGPELIEHDVASLSDVTVQGAQVVLTFLNGARYQFDAGGAEGADQVRLALESGRSQWNDLSSSDALERARLSPLVDSGVPNPLAPTQPHVREPFLQPALSWGLTAISAVILGWAVWWWRNELSEKALYDAAVAEDTVESYHAYLERGGARREVTDVLLPRAQLNEARDAGTIEAIEKYIAAHPTTTIGPEIQAAHREALLRLLETAKKKGTVAAIEEVSKHAGSALITDEIATARHAVYARALKSFLAEANPDNAKLAPFAQRLIAYVEKHGPRVDVRFHHNFPQDPEKLDGIVMKSRKYYLGQVCLPTQYFTGEKAQARQTALGEALVARFQKSFPKDVLEFHFLGPVEKNVEPPEAKVPTLTIRHTERLSGGFVGGKPKSMFLGASVGISGTFEIPDDGDDLVHQYGAWRAPRVGVLSLGEKTIPEVYEQMIGGAFDEFRTQYLASIFREP